MIKRGKHLIKSHMTLEYAFSGIRLQEGSLSPVDWMLKINLVALGNKTKSKDEAEHEAGLAYQKIYYWLDTNLPQILLVDVGNHHDLYVANLVSNVMMYCPGTTSDDLIVQLIHAKISAIAAPLLIVGEVQLKGSDTALQYTYDCSDGDYMLPELTADYYVEGTARDKFPWWYRDDGFCFELIRDKESTLTDAEQFKDVVDPMDNFRQLMEELIEPHISISREPAKIVQVEKWTPKKV